MGSVGGTLAKPCGSLRQSRPGPARSYLGQAPLLSAVSALILHARLEVSGRESKHTIPE